MKSILIWPLIFAFCVSCNTKAERTNSIDKADSLSYPDFVVDTTLQRQYLEDSTTSSMPNDWSGEVSSPEIAFKIAEPILNSCFGKEAIASQKPFSINLIDNKIWVLEGTLHQPQNGIIMGGTAYIEIRKSNGEILKIIHSE